MKSLSLYICIFLTALTTTASEASVLLDSATHCYERKAYAKAAFLYDSLITIGYHSASLVYNLGNCYYKQEDFIQAILQYERALKADPTNEDIAYNLKLARLNVVDKSEGIEKGLFNRWYDKMLQQQSPHEWLRDALFVLWFAFLLAVLFLFLNRKQLKRIFFALSLIMLLFSFILIMLATQRKAFDKTHISAIIMTQNTYVKSEPGGSGLKLFMLHGGAKVQVLDRNDGWVKIRFSTEKIGWMPEEDVEII